jgi:antitoxin (DNA-binding transcriptional repressor) of toxin-antitoxin stability system
VDGETVALTMRELGKLTAEQVGQLRHPVAVTNNGLPVAWLVPLTASERRRAELVAAGRLKPGHPQGLFGVTPLPQADSGPTLSELLLQMRAQERA